VPGNYVAEVHANDGSDAFLRAVIVGGVQRDSGFSVTGPMSIDLIIGANGGTIEGVVLDADKPVAGSTVVAVPEEKYRKLHERYGIGSTDQNGHFSIRSLAPGTYSVFAWQDLDDGLYYDAAFLVSQESNGMSIKIEEGMRRKLELRLSPIADDWK